MVSRERDASDLLIRAASLDDVDRFEGLMKAAFNLPIAPGHFRWKYVENPAGPVVAFEAVNAAGPVALYALMPHTYVVGGQRTRVFKAVDSMTHPDYQGRGLFPKLAREAYRHVLETEGSCTLIGIPGGRARHSYLNRLDWTLIHVFARVVLPRKLFRVRGALKRRAPDWAFVDAASGAALSPYLDRPRELVRPVTLELSPAFLDWRAFNNPYGPAGACLITTQGEPAGICVFFAEEGGRCLISCIDCLHPEDHARYMPGLIDYLFERTGSSALYTWEPLELLRRRALRRCGFIKNPLPRGPASTRLHLTARSEPRVVNGVDWLDAANFDLQPIMYD